MKLRAAATRPSPPRNCTAHYDGACMRTPSFAEEADLCRFLAQGHVSQAEAELLRRLACAFQGLAEEQLLPRQHEDRTAMAHG
jgi:hypothetical protein